MAEVRTYMFDVDPSQVNSLFKELEKRYITSAYTDCTFMIKTTSHGIRNILEFLTVSNLQEVQKDGSKKLIAKL